MLVLSAATGKMYGLKQHFLPPATAWRFTTIKYVVLKNKQVVTHKETNEYMEEY